MASSREELYEAALDATQEYLDLQEALGAALRAGFLSLAQARYSLGADRVSALQYPAHMQASATLRAAGDGGLELMQASAPPASALPAAARSSSSTATTVAASAAAATAAADGKQPAAAGPGCDGSSGSGSAGAEGAQPEAGPAGGEAVEDVLARLRLAAQQSDSIVDQLAAKYCSSSASGSGSSGDGGGGGATCGGGADEATAAAAAAAAPTRPLQWFGSLVPPSLREAEGHFGRALALAVQAANAQRRLRHGLDGYRAAKAAAAGQGQG